MPPNTTAVLQPLDQGIIHCVNVGYRRILVKKQLSVIEKDKNIKQFLKEMSLLDVRTGKTSIFP